MNQPALLSVKSAGEILFGEFTPATRDRMYRFIKSGQIKSLKDGKRFWIPSSEIERLRQGEISRSRK
jgi:hypothetical protein